MPAWITSELRELVWVPIASSASRITTSRPASASARATASPTTPAPITTASILSMARGIKSGRQCITIRIAFSWPRTSARAAGSSGSTAAAPSPTWSRGGPTARSPRTSCCRRTRSTTPTPRWPASATCSGSGRRADPAGHRRGGEDGHHRRHQRAARAQGRAHRAVHHARFRRRAAHRLPEPAAPVRAPHRAARDAVREVVEVDERVGAHGEVVVPLNLERPVQDLRRLPRRASQDRDRVHARLPLSRTRSQRSRAGAARSASRRSRSRTRSAR